MQLLGTSVASVVKDFSGVFNALPMLAVALIGFALAQLATKWSNDSEWASSQKEHAANDSDEGGD